MYVFCLYSFGGSLQQLLTMIVRRRHLRLGKNWCQRSLTWEKWSRVQESTLNASCRAGERNAVLLVLCWWWSRWLAWMCCEQVATITGRQAHMTLYHVYTMCKCMLSSTTQLSTTLLASYRWNRPETGALPWVAEHSADTQNKCQCTKLPFGCQ